MRVCVDGLIVDVEQTCDRFPDRAGGWSVAGKDIFVVLLPLRYFMEVKQLVSLKPFGMIHLVRFRLRPLHPPNSRRLGNNTCRPSATRHGG